MLNSKYFKHINTYNGFILIKPLESLVILFSLVDGTPLASLHLRCQDNEFQNDRRGNHGCALITKRSNKNHINAHFQGLVNRDNQEIELVISNLTKEHIGFNVLKVNDNYRGVKRN
jgi:hypothetical protein